MNILKLFTLLTVSFVGFAHAQNRIPAGRAIEIRIQGVPADDTQRINNQYPVSVSGYIRMPFIGNVRAAGLTPDALAQSIEAAYRAAKIYTSPTIQVFASSDQSIDELKVTIGGYVRRPGPVRYERGLTLYEAVQAAGGASEFGAENRVELIRNGKVTKFNLKETSAKTFVMQPNDAVEVPQKNIFNR